MNNDLIPRPASLPEGYESAWPEEGLPRPLWEPHALRPHHDEVPFNVQALELGLAAGAEEEEFLLTTLYEMRTGHSHQAFGTLLPPQGFRLIEGRYMGPVLDYQDFRSVFALISDERRVKGYVSARIGQEGLLDVRHFATGLEDLARIIGYDAETVPVPLGYWCSSGANGPEIRE